MHNEKKEIVLQSLIQGIPYVGGSLSTLYFGSKQEKRFKRIEDFYNEIKDEINNIKDSIKPIDNHNQEELSAILEELHDKIESEHLEIKKKYYKQYFKSTLINPVNGNFNERKFFLDILSNLTPLQIEILIFIYQQQSPIPSNGILKPGIDASLITGSINQLKTFGLVKMKLDSIAFTNMGGSMNEKVSMSKFGEMFHEFCIQ